MFSTFLLQKMNKKKIESHLEKIMQSREFADSETYKQLLAYLVKASLAQQQPKEATIAYDVFGKKYDQTLKDDTTVRVYVHNLRKKLDSYYLNEGCKDSLVFSIPKGHYRVVFKEQQKNKSQPSRILFPTLNIAFLIITLLIAWFWIHKKSSKSEFMYIPADNPVWSTFIKNDLPTLIALGDYYLYKEYTPDWRLLYVRDVQINSDKDMQAWVKRKEDQSSTISQTTHSFLGKFAPWSLTKILPTFWKADKAIELKLSSNLQWEDIRSKNIIFIGSFKTFRLLNNLVGNLSFNYQIYPNQLDFIDAEEDTVYSYNASTISDTEYVEDYGVVARLPGTNNNAILIFASTHDVGHISMVDYFTTPDHLKAFEQNYLQDDSPVFFESIFKVQGFQRTGLQTTLLHFNKIDAKISFQNRF
jgi:hypothetical protein